MVLCRSRNLTSLAAILALILINATTSSKAFLVSPRVSRPRRACHTEQNSHVSRFVVQGKGLPSSPGWKSGRLDRLSDWAESDTPNRPIICEYSPSGFWLWRKWSGTVIQSSWRSVLAAITVGLVFDVFVKGRSPFKRPWLFIPKSEHPLFKGLLGLRKVWEYQLTIATFVLAFFLSQSHAYWQKIYNTARVIQGRANDFCILITMGAKRHGSKDGEGTGFDNKSEQLVKLCTRLIRMSHIFFWAATKTASNGLSDCERFMEDTAKCPLPFDDEHIGPVLLSPFGLKALVDSGQLKEEESMALMESGLPPSQYAYILLVWVGIHALNGIEDGIFRGGTGFEGNLLRQLTELRAAMFDIDDLRAGRMPLAYVQLVQVLVDSLVMVAPFALYSDLGSLSTLCVGLMAFFYRGLLVLSKSLLDPFGVDGYENQNIRVDTLVSELNFGASKRWIQAGTYLPTSEAKD